jgi:cytochrome c biogenesis protein CcmG/thiol:disulfide interchange protein DsbE
VSTPDTDAPTDSDLAPARGRGVLITSIVVGVIVALLVALLITRDPAEDRPSASPVVGEPAPALGGEALIGQPYDIGTNDRWLLVNFFATWCVPCVQEHPELRKLAEDGAEAGDLNVVSVVYGDKADRVEEFFEDNGGDWTVLDSDEGRTALDWGVAKVPESFLVAPSGVVVERFQGGVRAGDVDALIASYEDQAGGGS